jgi:hypothetical protein
LSHADVIVRKVGKKEEDLLTQQTKSHKREEEGDGGREENWTSRLAKFLLKMFFSFIFEFQRMMTS